jgi:predicted Zn-dependent peptidase
MILLCSPAMTARFPRLLTLPAALAFLLPLSAAAAIDRSKKPEPGPAPEAAFPDYVTRELPNGLKVFVITDDRRPSVTFRLLIKGGASMDGEKAGLSSFVAALLNRGTQKRDAIQFATESDSIGARVEAAAGPDGISVSASALTKYTDSVLDLMIDAVLHPVFPEDQFSLEKKKTLSAIAAEKQEPDQLAEKLAARATYGPEHPYGRSRTEESVNAITRDDLAAYHRAWFAPNHATLAVVGDVEPEKILARVAEVFSAWEKKEIPAIKVPQAPPVKGITIHLVDRPASVQSNIVVLRDGPPRNTPDVPQLNVMNATLGGGFSGRLFQNLREKRGWTYGAYSAFSMQRFGGDFSARAETRNEVTAAAVSEIIGEMKRLQEEPVPASELELQRQYNVGNYLLSLENASRTAQRVQDIEFYALDPDFYKHYARRMAETTAEQVRDMAKKYLSTGDLVVVIVGKADEIREDLKKLGKVIEYDLDLKPKP